MNINDIYETNDKIHDKLTETVSKLTDEQAKHLPEGEKWTVAEFVEHIAIVQDGMTRISGKLLAQAQSAGKKADGSLVLSESFAQKASEMKRQKFEAPDRVRPTGKQTIAESLKKMKETQGKLEELRPLFQSIECSDYKFPHPLMGDLTAHEWLALIGGHAARHLRQIKNLLEKV